MRYPYSRVEEGGVDGDVGGIAEGQTKRNKREYKQLIMGGQEFWVRHTCNKVVDSTTIDSTMY